MFLEVIRKSTRDRPLEFSLYRKMSEAKDQEREETHANTERGTCKCAWGESVYVWMC